MDNNQRASRYLCEMKDLEMTAQFLGMSVGHQQRRLCGMQRTCVSKRGLKEGVWFEPVKALLKRKVNHRWTARHAAQPRPWVVDAKKKAVRHDLGGQQKM